MNLNQSWELKIDKEVYKKFSRLPKKDSERIIYAIESLARNPYFGDIEKIKAKMINGADALVITEFFITLNKAKELLR